MEDEKLAAYYYDLTRRGSGASRFKQGLGFSSGDQPAGDAIPSRGSALTSSSFFSGFVRASSPSKTSEFEKHAQLQSIQNKLSRKPKQKARSRSTTRKSSRRIRSRSRSRSSSRDRISDKHSRHRSRSRSRGRYSRRRSRSRSRDRRSRRRSRSHEDKERRKHRSRSRSREKNRERSKREVRGNGGIDYAKSIEGYDNMTPAERVRAKMKLQLSKTAEKDETIGKGSGWERFDFDKDAPLDEEEIEEAEDDAVLVKNITQSFRFSAVEARREDKLKAAHDEAMFGGSSHPLPDTQTDNRAREEGLEKENTISAPIQSLLSEQILTMQRGSWRDRARKS